MKFEESNDYKNDFGIPAIIKDDDDDDDDDGDEVLPVGGFEINHDLESAPILNWRCSGRKNKDRS
ncbi:hypothetical protein Scep_012082 [Stephania cephalantha]|uniref:Uncharacterized protein n=1 Tax=Stephania cephalantha TaxID=152367 RepID=A0AAP0JEG5_9MAGN